MMNSSNGGEGEKCEKGNNECGKETHRSDGRLSPGRRFLLFSKVNEWWWWKRKENERARGEEKSVHWFI